MVDFQSDYKDYLKQDNYQGQETATDSSTLSQKAPQFSQDMQTFSQPDASGFDTVVNKAATDAATATQSAQSAALKAQEKAVAQQQAQLQRVMSAYQSASDTFSPEDMADAIETLPAQTKTQSGQLQKSILGKQGVITQRFGNRSAVEKFSKGINYGTDIAVPKGTTVALPPGEWKVLEAFDKATAEGVNNKQQAINRGYGNSILAQNIATGEKIRLSHLSQVGVQGGQTINGGTVIGKTGATGNVAGRTGQHLDIEYYTSKGKVADILRSNYGRFLVGDTFSR